MRIELEIDPKVDNWDLRPYANDRVQDDILQPAGLGQGKPNVTDRQTYEGGCHCGAVRFQVVVDKHEAHDCNCSICTKKGFLHLIVPPEQFALLQGSEVLSTYTFNTGVARHTFCSICGIHPFYRPRSHPNDYDVNIRCLDGNILSKFHIIPFNGANWEENIDRLR